MRPEYRNQIDSKYSKKVEGIVRKAPKGIKDFKDDFEGETMECPICDANLPNMDVTCYQCKTTLPICIATVSWNFIPIKSNGFSLSCSLFHFYQHIFQMLE